MACLEDRVAVGAVGGEVSVVRKPLHIEPYATGHEAACRDALKRVFGADDLSQGYYRLNPGRTVVAILQDRSGECLGQRESPRRPAQRCGGVAPIAGRASAVSYGRRCCRQAARAVFY